jgi:rhodanese-related sulfurtransferase
LTIKQITSHELAIHLANDRPVVLIDVRESWEHEMAAIAGSILIPLGELPARAGEVKQPPEGLVVVYCHHGVRSLTAAALLQRLGLQNVASLAGGIDAWSCEVDPEMPRY